MIIFCFEQFEDVESKTFIVRLLNGYRAQLSTTFVPTGPRPLRRRPPKPQRPIAPGKRLRPNAAALGGEPGRGEGCRVPALKRSHAGRHGQQWPGASEAGPEIPVSNLGHLKKVFAIEIYEKHVCICSKCLEKVVAIRPKKFGINDHNITCLYVWRMDDL